MSSRDLLLDFEFLANDPKPGATRHDRPRWLPAARMVSALDVFGRSVDRTECPVAAVLRIATPLGGPRSFAGAAGGVRYAAVLSARGAARGIVEIGFAGGEVDDLVAAVDASKLRIEVEAVIVRLRFYE